MTYRVRRQVKPQCKFPRMSVGGGRVSHVAAAQPHRTLNVHVIRVKCIVSKEDGTVLTYKKAARYQQATAAACMRYSRMPSCTLKRTKTLSCYIHISSAWSGAARTRAQFHCQCAVARTDLLPTYPPRQIYRFYYRNLRGKSRRLPENAAARPRRLRRIRRAGGTLTGTSALKEFELGILRELFCVAGAVVALAGVETGMPEEEILSSECNILKNSHHYNLSSPRSRRGTAVDSPKDTPHLFT